MMDPTTGTLSTTGSLGPKGKLAHPCAPPSGSSSWEWPSSAAACAPEVLPPPMSFTPARRHRGCGHPGVFSVQASAVAADGVSPQHFSIEKRCWRVYETCHESVTKGRALDCPA